MESETMAVAKAMLSTLALASPLLPTETVLRMANRVLGLLRLEVRIGNGLWERLGCEFEAESVGCT